MHVLLIAIGSAGDVHPFIAVGRALAGRGHRVTLLVNRHFEERVRGAGLGFRVLAEADEYRRVLNSHRLLDETLGPRFVIEELVLPHVPRVLHEGAALIAEDRPDAIVAHHICSAAPWLGERHGIPVATVSLAPLFWLSSMEPLCFGPLRRFVPPLWLSRLHLALGRRAGRVLIDARLNPYRQRLGLAPRTGFFFPGPHRGAIELGLWSRHLRPALFDDPRPSHVCGFARFDRRGAEDATLDPDLERFVAAGTPPLVFSLGSTAVHGAGDFYAAAAAACRSLGRRGVLLTGGAAEVPPDLPDDVRAFAWAPFDALLPRGAGTIHHGGIGTTGAALACGRPQVVVPFANDEFDNAARVERLGVSRTVRRTGRLPLAARLAGALAALLGDARVGARAQALGAEIAAEDGAAEAARMVEALAAGALAGTLPG